MKQEVIKRKHNKILESDMILNVVKMITYFLAGMLASRSAVLENYAPFGAALTAACPKKYSIPVLLGTTIGYLLPSSIDNPLKYVAAIIAVAGIKWALDGLKIVTHIAFSPVLAFVSMAGTGISILIVSGSAPFDFVMVLADSVLAGCGAFFIFKTIDLSGSKRMLKGLTGQELSSVIITFGIMLIALCSFEISEISPGRIIAILLVLLCARYGNAAFGAVAGVSAGIVMSLASKGMGHLTGAYAFGGLMSGVFSPIGRIGCAIAFVASNGIGALTTDAGSRVIASLYEVFIGTVTFMLIPKSVTRRISVFFEDTKEKTAMDVKENIVSRLRIASKALDDVSNSVETVSSKLLKMKTESLNEVYDKVLCEVCDKCGQKNFCWNARYLDTMNIFNDFSSELKRSGKLILDDIPEYFKSQCEMPQVLADAINNNYSEFLLKNDAAQRMNEIKHKLSQRFDGVSQMLKNLGDEFADTSSFDLAATDRARSVFEAYGIYPRELSCKLDKLAHMTVEAVFKQSGETLPRFELTEALSKACERSFDIPSILEIEDLIRIIFTERARLEVSVGVAQHAYKSGPLCGDAVEYFNDNTGHSVLIISDGMGSGGRAAVDSAMTAGLVSKLLKAGFTYDNTLGIVNEALMIRDCEESLSTIDLVSFDNFTGKCDFLKAGAHFSFVKKGERVLCVDGNSLPIGILNEVEFEKLSARLDEGDIIVMMSDGMCENTEWIEHELMNFKTGSAQRLAERLLDIARMRRTDGHDDDITVLTAIVKPSER